MVIKRRKHQWKQQKKIWNMGNTSTKVLSMKWFWKIWKRTGSIIWNIFREWKYWKNQTWWIRLFLPWMLTIMINIQRQMYAEHLLMITVHQRIFRHCCLRLRCLFWRKSRRLRRKKPGNILGTVCICLPLFILQITVRITVFTADLTAIIRSAEQSWMQKRLIRKWLLSQRQDCRKSWFLQERAEQNLM